MEILKNRFKFMLPAIVAVLLPLNGYCYDNVLRNPEDYYPFMGMALAFVFVLLVFAVIFYAISHKTKREKMHIEMLVEMVKQGYLPTSEQIASKSVVDDISFDNKGQIQLKRKTNFSFPKLLLVVVGVLWFFGAMDVTGNISAIMGVAGSFVIVYAIIDMKNVPFWQRNIITLNVINLVLGLGALLIGILKFPNFAKALIPCLLPGGFLIYYAVSMLNVYDKMPHFEFKIKKVERMGTRNKINEIDSDDIVADTETK